MITILCQNCGGAIEVNPETSPKKKARCPYCKKLIFKRTGNVVEWSTKKKKLTGRQKLWYAVASCACFCVIFFGMTDFSYRSKKSSLQGAGCSDYPEWDLRSKWSRGAVVSVVGGPVLGDVKKYNMRGWTLDEESTAEDALHFVKLYQLEDEMHVFKEGDKARVLEVGPGCVRLLPFNDTRKSFWVWFPERLKREKE